MIEIGRDKQFMSFDAQGMVPAAYAKDGEIIRFHTQDCYGDLLVNEQVRRKDLVGKSPKYNPTTGPVYIEGACKGDTLKVEILKIKPADHGTMRLTPGSGKLKRDITKEHVRIFPIEEGADSIDFDGVKVRLRPMIGVIGVAPEEGCWDTDTPYKHGGNMDNHDIVEGCTMYFPVHQDGAMFGLGDLHGVMGDGEVCICGLEMAAEVDVRVSVIKGVQEAWPMWEMDGRWATMCSAETLDKAAEDARYAMLDFLKKRMDMDVHEIIMLLSLVGDTSVCQVVDPLVTVRFTLSQSVGNICF